VVTGSVTSSTQQPMAIDEPEPGVAIGDVTAHIRPTFTRTRRPFRWFTPALGLLLVGYLFFSRSFAYLHIPGTPVFVGEIVLAIGVLEAVRLRPPWIPIIRSSPILKALAAFMALCAVRLAIDLPEFGIDALRDSAIWYYGAYAFVVTIAATYDPAFTPRLFRWYRRAVPWFLAWTPFAIVLAEVDALAAMTVPDSTTPINAFRSGDYAVHVAIAIAFPWLGLNRLAGEPDRPRSELALAVLAMLTLLMAGSQNRGGLAAALLLMAIVMLYLPGARRRRIILPVTASLLVVIAVVVMLDLRIPGQRRDVSVQQVMENITSVVESNDTDLAGTVEWRQQLWRQVIDDLLSSRAWFTGLGFGPILPERYNIPLDPDNPAPLRNVHNSHLTIIARVGFAVFALWLLFWIVWTHHLVRFIRHRAGRLKDPSAAMAAWLLGASAAFLVNAFFDPALEGPHAGIWLFVLVGLGAAHTRYRRRPTVRPTVWHTS
jgi:hypothetical protein